MKYRTKALAFALWSLLSVSGTAHGGTEMMCRESPQRITAVSEDAAQAGRVCRAVLTSVDLLKDCGLTQIAPIRMEVVDGPIDDNPGCLGEFDCRTDEIRLLTTNGLSRALGSENALRGIPLDRVQASIVTHELAHAFLYQMRGGPGDTVAEDEYVAYAMQFLSLSEADRIAVLEAIPGQDTTITRDMLNDVFLALAPMVFGGWAWRHFSRQPDGCGFVSDIVSGKVDFSIHDRFP